MKKYNLRAVVIAYLVANGSKTFAEAFQEIYQVSLQGASIMPNELLYLPDLIEAIEAEPKSNYPLPLTLAVYFANGLMGYNKVFEYVCNADMNVLSEQELGWVRTVKNLIENNF